MDHIRLFYKSLYNSIYFRIFIGYINWFYKVKILKKVKFIESDKSIDGTIKHNARVLSKFPLTDFTMQRMDRLICSVKAIEFIGEGSEILVIGPRTESDIFKLIGFFPKSTISGIDLISYSKYIHLGDAHDMKYPDNYFDAIISGWVISYTKRPERMLLEMIRVTKSEGVLSIGMEHVDDSSREYVNTKTDKNVDINEIYINSLNDIKLILKKLKINFIPIFEYDALLKNKTTQEKYHKTRSHSTQILFTFQIIK